MEKPRTKVYISDIPRTRDTARLAWFLGDKYSTRIKTVLSGKDPLYYSKDVADKLSEKREKTNKTDMELITDFIRWKWAYVDSSWKLRCHPVNLATPYLLYLHNILRRANESTNKEIVTFIITRHAERLRSWELTEKWKKQAENLWEKLREYAGNLSKKNEWCAKKWLKYREPIYIFWHSITFESIVTTLFFGKNYWLGINNKSFINKRNTDMFPHNNLEDKEAKEYLYGDWTKALDYAESLDFTLYPSIGKNEAYLEINWRGKRQKITYSKLDKIVKSLRKKCI